MKSKIKIVFLLIFVMILSSLANAQTNQDSIQYNKFIVEGDALYKVEKYHEAKTKYESSLKLSPRSAYPTAKIAECVRNIQAKEYAIATESKYKAAIKAADQAFVNLDINAAKNYYTQACAIKPTEVYPKSRIAECDVWLKDKMVEAQYQKMLQAAFEKLNQYDYRGAKDLLNKAQGLKPQSSFCKDNILLIDNELKRQHEIEVKRIQYIAKADSCLLIKDTNNAKINYQLALDIKEECSVVSRLSLLQKEFVCCGEAIPPFSQEYVCTLNKGEFYYKLKKYTEAITYYEEALKIMPNEQYPKYQIKICKKLAKK